MKIRTAMLANHIEVRDGMFYVMGGSPEWWSVDSLPGVLSPALGLILEREPGEANSNPRVGLTVSNEAGVLSAGDLVLVVRR